MAARVMAGSPSRHMPYLGRADIEDYDHRSRSRDVWTIFSARVVALSADEIISFTVSPMVDGELCTSHRPISATLRGRTLLVRIFVRRGFLFGRWSHRRGI